MGKHGEPGVREPTGNENERVQKGMKKEIQFFLLRAMLMAALIWIFFGMIFGLTPMKNNDMSPRISSGDLLLYYRLDKNLLCDDVIVFEKEGKQYTGRIVAKGGDTVEIGDNAELMVNNSVVIENNIFYRTPRYEDGISYPVKLLKNQYFVLCDYREGAKDSRYFGAVDSREIKGKVITVIRRSNL
ncbi:signal peptidase I [Novisyntrophococcus fermenticellae]|uniref:signal peptidase I n=1 Tax=Novisyntrophococcus fermenticellae TaxID=2068655 RepID=UPI001E63084A|nr:signal peptidase I [Novisyntrophococcus fermenticellae]